MILTGDGPRSQASIDEKRLTAADRKKISKKDTANPSKRTKKGGAVSGSYPIPDLAHARAALSLVAKHGDAATKKRVRAKVYKKFPQLKKSSSANKK